MLYTEQREFRIPIRPNRGQLQFQCESMIRVKDIPKATRWTMATHVLTRLVVALGHEPAGGASVAPYRERMFSEMAREIRAIADRYGMPRENAADLVQTLGAISVILFGPEFETRYIEGFPDEAVIRLTGCAMFGEERAGSGAPAEVGSICQAYVQHAIVALNPGFTISVAKARCRGDAFCEMVIERRKP
jgi:hypothetical protein